MEKFSGNIRSIEGLSDDVLRDAMRGGWNKELPAIKDERGAVLVGHRRLKIAQELGIEPVIKVVPFGDGPDAEAARIRLANVSNIGGVPLTREDRKRQAERLYSSGVTMKSIAHMLGVSEPTISNDLANSLIVKESKPAKTASNPKGAGRPKGTRTSKRGKETPKQDAARAVVRAKLEANEPISPHKLQDEHGISHVTFDMAITAELARKEALEEKHALDPAYLSKSAQEKLDAAIRAHKRLLEAQHEKDVQAEARRRLEETTLPSYRETWDEYLAERRRRKGVMKGPTFMLIWSCLHPDSRKSTSDDKLNRAFNAFESLKSHLLNEEDDPTPAFRMPKTYSELMEMKRQAKEARREKRQQNATAVRTR